MTTFDPDTQAHDPDILRGIIRRFGGRLALNAAVTHGGLLRVGDTVRVERPTERSHSIRPPTRLREMPNAR